MKTIVLLPVLFAPALAHADQCEINRPSITAAAEAIVKQGSKVAELCEPCGDTAPGATRVVTTVETRRDRLFVNGTEADLAYLYIETAPGELHNVGKMTNCGAKGVSEWIHHGRPSSSPVDPYKAPHAYTPPPRPTTTDELAGTWNVMLSTRMSTCASVPTGTVKEQWTIASTGGRVSVSGSHLPLEGTFTTMQPWFRATLHPLADSSSELLELSFLQKDLVFGTIVRAEVQRDPRDPVCVARQEISARRVP